MPLHTVFEEWLLKYFHLVNFWPTFDILVFKRVGIYDTFDLPWCLSVWKVWKKSGILEVGQEVCKKSRNFINIFKQFGKKQKMNISKKFGKTCHFWVPLFLCFFSYFKRLFSCNTSCNIFLLFFFEVPVWLPWMKVRSLNFKKSISFKYSWHNDQIFFILSCYFLIVLL